MNLTTIEIQIRLVGALAFVFIGYSLCMGSLTLKDLPANYSNPVLALELVSTGDHINEINKAGNGAAHTFISEQLRRDTGFIVLYVLFFSAVGLLVTRLITGQLKWLSILGVVCAVAAGVFDFLENRGMVKALATHGDASNELANSIRFPSLTKWALIYFVCLLIGTLFIRGHELLSLHALSFAWLLVLGGIIGIIGVVLNLITPRSYPTFLIATLLTFVATVWLAIVFTLTPEKVLGVR